MTEIEMLNEAKRLWQEVNEIVEETDFLTNDEIEEFLKNHPDFSNVRKVDVGGSEVIDFDYKKITGTISVNDGCLPELSKNVDYWENEEGSVHCFEIKY